MTRAVAFNAVAFIIQGVLVPASLTSNSGSWASFLSRLGPLPVARYNAFGTMVQSIAPIGLGRICASLSVGYGVFDTTPLLLSQGTIVGSVFLPDVVSNSCPGMLSSILRDIVRWMSFQDPSE